MAAPQHDLDPARRHGQTLRRCRRLNGRYLFWAARWAIVGDNGRRKPARLSRVAKPSLPPKSPPCEQLARRQAISPRRRRYRRAIALSYDPLLLRQGPAPPCTCRNYLKPRNRQNRRMLSHTPMCSPTRRAQTRRCSAEGYHFCAGCHIRQEPGIIWLCNPRGAMTTIKQQAKSIGTWLRRATLRRELTNFSDRALQDIGVSRHHVSIEVCKPFWMA